MLFLALYLYALFISYFYYPILQRDRSTGKITSLTKVSQSWDLIQTDLTLESTLVTTASYCFYNMSALCSVAQLCLALCAFNMRNTKVR